MKPRSNFVILIGLLLSTVFMSASGLRAQTEAEVKAHYTKTEAQITMRDGVRLFTSIYSPKDRSGKYPIMLSRTPYSVSPYGRDEYKTLVGPSLQFQKERFIFVYQDVRGKFMSEGDYVNMRPHIRAKTARQVDESSDTYDTIEWLVKGHRIMVQIQSSWFPLVDRNPQEFVYINTASASDFQKANQRVYRSPKYSSHLTLNVLK